ncbi:MAG: 5-formyltetrahydrofolate cyclo-ligase, partial [Planctomycetota bacterium]
EALVPGPFGIPEPPEGQVLPPAAIDFAIVPGRAFAPDGSRLGRGGGYFDRFLPLLRKDAILAGVAFDEQIVAALPREIHDVAVRLVVTPTRILGPTAGTP